MNNKKGLRKNLYIIIFLNLLLLVFAVSYSIFFKLNDGNTGALVCKFKETFGLYCPGCGGTRALYHLLKLDL